MDGEEFCLPPVGSKSFWRLVFVFGRGRAIESKCDRKSGRGGTAKRGVTAFCFSSTINEDQRGTANSAGDELDIIEHAAISGGATLMVSLLSCCQWSVYAL